MSLLTKDNDGEIVSYANSFSNAKVINRQLKMKLKDASKCIFSLTLHKTGGHPLNMKHVQSAVLMALLGPHSPSKPVWCTVSPWRNITQCIVVLAESDLVIDATSTQLPYLSGNFLHRITLDGCREGEDILSQLCQVQYSLTDVLKEKLSNSEFNKVEQTERSVETCQVMDLVLTSAALLEENIPMPDADNPHDFVFLTKPPHPHKQPVYAIDCEMCITSKGSELTRISVIDENESVILDEFVKPPNPITDYLTKFSGITERTLVGVTTTLKHIQKCLQNIIPKNAILLGHTIGVDLKALQLYHPYVIDLTRILNFSGSYNSKSSLKTMCATFLNCEIQNCPNGHCSTEDAIAALRLFKMKMKNGIQFGDVVLGWNFAKFATDRGIDPRTGGSSEEEVNRKKRRLKAEQPNGYETKLKKIKKVKCAKCLPGVTFECVKTNCLCNGDPPKYCAKCLVENSEDGGCENSWKTNLEQFYCALEVSLRESSAQVRSISQVLQGQKKKCCILKECNKVEATTSCALITQTARECVLEKDLLIMKLGETKLSCIDEAVNNICISAARKAIIFVIIQCRNVKPLLFVTIKHS